MNILQIIPHLDCGGAEIGCVDLANHLTKLGHHSFIATHSGRMASLCPDTTVWLHPLHRKDPLAIWRNSHWLKQHIDEHAIDLVHVRSRAPAWSTYWACEKSHTPWLATYHGAYRQTNRFKHTYNSIMTRGHAVIAPSETMYHHVLHHYPQVQHKLVSIPRGICTERFAANQPPCPQLKRQLNLEPAQHVVVLPARMTRLKGHHVCIQAIASIKHQLRQQQVRVCFVGDQSHTSYVQSLRQAITQHQLHDIISLHEHLSAPEKLIALADIVLICSTQPESFGRTAVEAQMMGKLVIGTNHGGCQDTIQHQKTGWLTTPGCPEDLAKTLGQALKLSAPERQAMQQHGQHWAKQHFSQQRMCDAITALYQQILRTHRHETIPN